MPTLTGAPARGEAARRLIGVTVLSSLAVNARCPSGVTAIPTGPPATAIAARAWGEAPSATGVTPWGSAT